MPTIPRPRTASTPSPPTCRACARIRRPSSRSSRTSSASPGSPSRMRSACWWARGCPILRWSRFDSFADVLAEIRVFGAAVGEEAAAAALGGGIEALLADLSRAPGRRSPEARPLLRPADLHDGAGDAGRRDPGARRRRERRRRDRHRGARGDRHRDHPGARPRGDRHAELRRQHLGAAGARHHRRSGARSPPFAPAACSRSRAPGSRPCRTTPRAASPAWRACCTRRLSRTTPVTESASSRRRPSRPLRSGAPGRGLPR